MSGRRFFCQAAGTSGKPRRHVTTTTTAAVVAVTGAVLRLRFLVFLVALAMCQSLVSSRMYTDDDLNKMPVIGIGEQTDDKIFQGRQEDGQEFFSKQIVLVEDNHVLIGARDTLYNISLSSMTEYARYEWPADDSSLRYCNSFENIPKSDCRNYIRTVAEMVGPSATAGQSQGYFICGTHAIMPKCRTLTLKENSSDYELVAEINGKGLTPPDPYHNSTLVHYGGKPFAATLLSSDPLIYSPPLRTASANSLLLNNPSFAGSFHYQGKIFFFFREEAVENINCGKEIFSRVAQVCPNDRGGTYVLRNQWTTFFKTRLNCSFPGDFPYYFNEIESITVVGEGNVLSTPIKNASDVVYAVFKTPRTAVKASAVCAFKMSDVQTAFAGRFKGRRDDTSIWLSLDPPNPHPAVCLSGEAQAKDATLHFVASTVFMDKAVPQQGSKPLFMQTDTRYSLTQVAVDHRHLAADEHYYDVLFLGTDDGRILKVFNSGRSTEIHSRLVEVLKMPGGQPVVALRVFADPEGGERRLLVVTRHQVASVPLHRCARATTCAACVAMRDPYCSWSQDECNSRGKGLQSLDSGKHSECADAEIASFTPSPCKLCKCVVSSHSMARQSSDARTDEEQSKTTTPTSPGQDHQSPYDAGEASYNRLVYPATWTCAEERECPPSTEGSSRGAVAVTALGIVLALIIGLMVGFFLGSRMSKVAVPVLSEGKQRVQAQTSENYYETGPPSSASSHRPIIPSQYWIKNRQYLRENSDLLQQQQQQQQQNHHHNNHHNNKHNSHNHHHGHRHHHNHNPSNSSSFTLFPCHSFPSGGGDNDDDSRTSATPSPKTRGLPQLRLNVFDFLKDGSPSDGCTTRCMSPQEENMELSKSEAETMFPFIDGLPSDRDESTFQHDPFQCMPTTPVSWNRENDFYARRANRPDAPPSSSASKDANGQRQRVKRNGFLVGSMTKVRSFLGSHIPVHL